MTARRLLGSFVSICGLVPKPGSGSGEMEAIP
jgi:hypothetical protein